MKCQRLCHEVFDLLIIGKGRKWSEQTKLLEGFLEDIYRKDKLQVHHLPEQQVARKSKSWQIYHMVLPGPHLSYHTEGNA